MKKILKIDSSSRVEGSHSRKFANEIKDKLLDKYKNSEVVECDLVDENIPHLQNTTIEAFFTPKDVHDERLSDASNLSDKLISQLKDSDEIILSVPMYNFSIPSSLKAYIDQISRVNETFSMDENGFSGLLKNKKLYIVISYGAVFSDTPLTSMDFVEGYLKSLFSFLGIEDIYTFKLEGSNMDAKAFEDSIVKANTQLFKLLEA